MRVFCIRHLIYIHIGRYKDIMWALYTAQVLCVLKILHLVHRNIFYQELGLILLDIIRIQVEGETSVQNQYLNMNQFINQN